MTTAATAAAKIISTTTKTKTTTTTAVAVAVAVAAAAEDEEPKRPTRRSAAATAAYSRRRRLDPNNKNNNDDSLPSFSSYRSYSCRYYNYSSSSSSSPAKTRPCAYAGATNDREHHFHHQHEHHQHEHDHHQHEQRQPSKTVDVGIFSDREPHHQQQKHQQQKHQQLPRRHQAQTQAQAKAQTPILKREHREDDDIDDIRAGRTSSGTETRSSFITNPLPWHSSIAPPALPLPLPTTTTATTTTATAEAEAAAPPPPQLLRYTTSSTTPSTVGMMSPPPPPPMSTPPPPPRTAPLQHQNHERNRRHDYHRHLHDDQPRHRHPQAYSSEASSSSPSSSSSSALLLPPSRQPPPSPSPSSAPLSAASSSSATSISKHYALNNQILGAFESLYAQGLYKVAYAIGMQFVEMALLEIPKHGYYASLRHADERCQSSLHALRVTELLQQIVQMEEEEHRKYLHQQQRQQQQEQQQQQQQPISDSMPPQPSIDAATAETIKIQKLHRLAQQQVLNVDTFQQSREALEDELKHHHHHHSRQNHPHSSGQDGASGGRGEVFESSFCGLFHDYADLVSSAICPPGSKMPPKSSSTTTTTTTTTNTNTNTNTSAPTYCAPHPLTPATGPTKTASGSEEGTTTTATTTTAATTTTTTTALVTRMDGRHDENDDAIRETTAWPSDAHPTSASPLQTPRPSAKPRTTAPSTHDPQYRQHRHHHHHNTTTHTNHAAPIIPSSGREGWDGVSGATEELRDDGVCDDGRWMAGINNIATNTTTNNNNNNSNSLRRPPNTTPATTFTSNGELAVVGTLLDPPPPPTLPSHPQRPFSAMPTATIATATDSELWRDSSPSFSPSNGGAAAMAAGRVQPSWEQTASETRDLERALWLSGLSPAASSSFADGCAAAAHGVIALPHNAPTTGGGIIATAADADAANTVGHHHHHHHRRRRKPRTKTQTEIDIRVLGACFQEDFETLRLSGRIHVQRLGTYQGRLAGSVNGCTVIAPLLCIHHFLNSPTPEQQRQHQPPSDSGLPNEAIEQVIDEETPVILPQVRTKLGLARDALIIPSDVHDFLIEKNWLRQDQFVDVVGGNILEEAHMTAFVEALRQSCARRRIPMAATTTTTTTTTAQRGRQRRQQHGNQDKEDRQPPRPESSSQHSTPFFYHHKKVAATLFFHEHVVTIQMVPRRKDCHRRQNHRGRSGGSSGGINGKSHGTGNNSRSRSTTTDPQWHHGGGEGYDDYDDDDDDDDIEFWYDWIDSLPSHEFLRRRRAAVGAGGGNANPADDVRHLFHHYADAEKDEPQHAEAFYTPYAVRIRCMDEDAFRATLRWYACSKFTQEDRAYIDMYAWDENESDFDPRVFQSFIWCEAAA